MRNALSDTLQSRAVFIAQMKAQEALGIFPDLSIDDTSNLFAQLFYSETQLRMEWRNASNGFFHHAGCKIARNIACSAVTTSSPRLK